MREMGCTKRIVSLIETLYSEQQSAVRTDSGSTHPSLLVSKGVRQGCIMSTQVKKNVRILNKQFGSQTVNMLFKLTGSVLLKARYITSHVFNFTKSQHFKKLNPEK